MTRPSASGRIEVICGCMFSGKTEELIRRIRQVSIARQSFHIFTPRMDTRYGSYQVASHVGTSVEALPVSSMTEVAHLVEREEGIQVVAVDELHFLDDPPDMLVSICQRLADQGRRVIAAGLDQDYRAEPFPTVAALMAVSEHVDKLYAICARCGAYATRSQRLINGQPAPADAPTLVVGGLELYEARCRACHIVGQ